MEPLEEIYKECRTNLGVHHPTTSRVRSTIKTQYRWKRKNLSSIESLEATYLKLRDTLASGTDPLLMVTLNQIKEHLSSIEESCNHGEDVTEAMEAILKRQQRTLGHDDVCTLVIRNIFLENLQKYKQLHKALELLQSEYDRQKTELGEDDPRTLSTRNKLADIMWLQGKSNEAVDLLMKEYIRQGEKFGKDSIDTIKTRNYLADTLWWVGRGKEGRGLLKEEYERLRRHLGEDHPLTRGTKNKLDEVLGWDNVSGQENEEVAQTYNLKGGFSLVLRFVSFDTYSVNFKFVAVDEINAAV